MSAIRLLAIVRCHQIRWLTAGRDPAWPEAALDSTADRKQKPVRFHSRDAAGNKATIWRHSRSCRQLTAASPLYA